MAAAQLRLSMLKLTPHWALWSTLVTLIVLISTACSEQTKPHKRKMNISCFAYRDINRNGTYDMSDRPYSGLEVFLKHPDGRQSMRKSNVAGFANFAMSLNNNAHEIRTPGRYSITAKAAEGWQITSGNAAQELIIKELEGSPAGLIAEQTLLPVGVAPELTISGRLELPANGDPTDYTVTGVFQTENTLEATPSAEGAYSMLAENGVWRLDFHGPDGLLTRRVVKLSNYPVIFSTVIPHRQYANRELENKRIGFDDLTQSDTLYEIPNGYANLNWHNWIATHHKFYGGHGYINGTVSGEYVAYNSSGHPATVESSTPFDFVGAFIAVAWPQAEKGFIDIKGWHGDELIYHDRIKTSTSGPIQFAAGYKNVTRVEFSTEHYWQIVMDDIEISSVSSKP